MSNYLKKTKRANEEIVYDELNGVKLITDYSKAWANYVLNGDYVKSVKVMLENGMKQPYIYNILRRTFDAGWNAK